MVTASIKTAACLTPRPPGPHTSPAIQLHFRSSRIHPFRSLCRLTRSIFR